MKYISLDIYIYIYITRNNNSDINRQHLLSSDYTNIYSMFSCICCFTLVFYPTIPPEMEVLLHTQGRRHKNHLKSNSLYKYLHAICPLYGPFTQY